MTGATLNSVELIPPEILNHFGRQLDCVPPRIASMQQRDMGFVDETSDLVAVSAAGMNVAGEVPPAPSSAEERLAVWCSRLPSPAPEMLRTQAAQGERYMETTELAVALGKKATGGHWNSGVALLCNNRLPEMSGKRLRVAELFR